MPALQFLVIGSGGFVVLNVDRADDVFVQCVALSGIVTAEASATLSTTDPDHREPLDPVTADWLLSLGWNPPAADPLTMAGPDNPIPNFHVIIAGMTGWLSPLLAELAVRTLGEVWEVEPSQVRVERRCSTDGPAVGITTEGGAGPWDLRP